MHEEKFVSRFLFAPQAIVGVVAVESIPVSLETVRNGGN